MSPKLLVRTFLCLTWLMASGIGIIHAADSVDPDYAVQGEYASPEGAVARKGFQVVALGEGGFRICMFNGGLPGAGWDGKEPQVLDDAEAEDLESLLKSSGAKRVERKSPTLEAAAPSGAIILWGRDAAEHEQNWKPGFVKNSDGSLSGEATTRQTFRDFSLHLEFRIPFRPAEPVTSRGDSGLLLHGRYEVQIQDSFGFPASKQSTGALCDSQAPELNLSFPPATWQTFDIDFSAPRFDESGGKNSPARATVRLNGIVVQRDVEIAPTTPPAESSQQWPLILQGGNDSVEFRNIWLLPRDADQESLRPRIPGYERFHAFSDHHAPAGRLLFGELGCVHCHTTSPEFAATLLPRQAPVLNGVGDRVNPDWMMKFIADPQRTKPGTLMPQLFRGWDESEKHEVARALTHFLASDTPYEPTRHDQRQAALGEKLFHSIGCAACHEAQNGISTPVATSVSLEGLSEKYNAKALAEFLQKPHTVRPSGRMPSLQLTREEASQLAQYLLRQGQVDLPPNVRFRVYEGAWDRLPDFDQLTPVKEGVCNGFDLSKAGRDSNFGMRFEAYFPRPQHLTIELGLGSDDGSRISFNGVPALDVDGVHPFEMVRKTVRLENTDVYHVRLDYFEKDGEEQLAVDFKIGDGPIQDLGASLQLDKTPNGTPPDGKKAGADTSHFKRDPELAAKGRQYFQALGCANCHHRDEANGTRIPAILKGPDLPQLDFNQGCLSQQSPSAERPTPAPFFSLSPSQVRDLRALVPDLSNAHQLGAEERVQQTLIAMNCYSCHVRDGIGGVETARLPLFQSSEQEMGDEGRIPPLLTGVGDKLQDVWLKNVLDRGAKNRPYMKTRMPAFGTPNVGHLHADFVELDRRTELQDVKFEEPLSRVKSTGRQLVGNGGLGCIKCHDFGEYRSTGIQAVSLTEMNSRIREDWFRRYLIEPGTYRPGTRMPTGFPNGQSVIRDIYDGDAARQTKAIWNFLQDGPRAGTPEGLIAQTVELIPTTRPILHRCYIENTSFRSIAVGYPQKVNLVWDMANFSLTQAWHDRFLDASKHWSSRGAGTQPPLGDHLIRIDPPFPLGTLESPEAPWPPRSAGNSAGYRMKGYSLNHRGEPVFTYSAPFGEVSDYLEPIAVNSHEGTLKRHLKIQLKPNVQNLYFLAAVAERIEPLDSGYRIDDSFTLRFPAEVHPLIRENGTQKELLLPLQITHARTVELTEEILW